MKWARFWPFIGRGRATRLLALGALPHDPMTGGSAPGSVWRIRLQNLLLGERPMLVMVYSSAAPRILLLPLAT